MKSLNQDQVNERLEKIISDRNLTEVDKQTFYSIVKSNNAFMRLDKSEIPFVTNYNMSLVETVGKAVPVFVDGSQERYFINKQL